MKRLKFLIAIFCLVVSLPLAYVVYQTYVGLGQEEKAQMRFFAETMFDQMEAELAGLIQKEESREVDEYGYFRAPGDLDIEQSVSSLAEGNYDPYIYGYLQNNPDGSFQTPLIADMGRIPDNLREKAAGIREVNSLFNEKKLIIDSSFAQPRKDKSAEQERIETDPDAVPPSSRRGSLSERYLKSAPSKTEAAGYLGKKQQRVEEITREQAFNIASEKEVRALTRQRTDSIQSAPSAVQAPTVAERMQYDRRQADDDEKLDLLESADMAGSMAQADIDSLEQRALAEPKLPLQVEVAPFQSVIIDEEKVYIFRRISMGGQMYRQGFIVLLEPLMKHLAAHYFIDQPLSEFSALTMAVEGLGDESSGFTAGTLVETSRFAASRQFPEPFEFLSVSLTADQIPVSGARGSLNLAILFLSLFMLAGLFVIYRSVDSIVAMSEKRSEFVSSVTHELKTPLTNIRMYIEMLEQGVALSPEKEQEYLAVLTRESGRLSILINNVLELARLEKKTRRFNMQKNSVSSVFFEIASTMEQNLKQEGFSLNIEDTSVEDFVFDRDVLIQILMNLIENAIKFGRDSAVKHITLGSVIRNGFVEITVSDTGPGIPRKEISKVFDDFYRVDNSLTKATGGTGLGLALVKKFVTAMAGRVSAANNEDRGCTFTISLPLTY
jgi:signal transduction histidine kinase